MNINTNPIVANFKKSIASYNHLFVSFLRFSNCCLCCSFMISLFADCLLTSGNFLYIRTSITILLYMLSCIVCSKCIFPLPTYVSLRPGLSLNMSSKTATSPFINVTSFSVGKLVSLSGNILSKRFSSG